MSSIVLNPGVKEMLLNDTRDFLKSEKVILVLYGTHVSSLTTSYSGMLTAEFRSAVATCCMVSLALERAP